VTAADRQRKIDSIEAAFDSEVDRIFSAMRCQIRVAGPGCFYADFEDAWRARDVALVYVNQPDSP
jgi:hypothetical protein